MRQDKKRTAKNRETRDELKKVIKDFETKPSSESLGLVFSRIDRAAKIGLIPRGRADRKKARLASKVKGSTSAPKAVKAKVATKKPKSVVKK